MTFRPVLALLSTASLLLMVTDRCQSLSCDDLGLVCSGQNPKEVSYTINRQNVPSKDGSAFVWSLPGTAMSLASRISCEEKSNHLLISAAGIPTGNVGKFPVNEDTDQSGHRDNPNTISAQTYQWKLPKTPVIKTTAPPRATFSNGQLPMGPIGFTLTGVPFYNPYNAQGLDAVDPNSNGYEVMDLCFGHPDPKGGYHHHYIKSKAGCLFQDTPGQHSPKIGYAFDGIPIYGPLSWNGLKPTDLDNCNGRNDPTLGYIYHTTDTNSPYILGCYRYHVIFAAVDNNPGAMSTTCVDVSSITGGPQGNDTIPTSTTTTSSAAELPITLTAKNITLTAKNIIFLFVVVILARFL